MSEFPIIELNRVRRVPKRGQYDKDTIYESWMRASCATWACGDGQPVVIPMNYARRDDTVVLHGAPASRLVKVCPGRRRSA